MNMNGLLSLVLCCAVWPGPGLAAALPDPTRPYQYGEVVQIEQAPGAKVRWHLSGVRINATMRSAILNGKVVKEGDKLDGAVVTQIRPSEVTLQKDDKRLVVKLLLSNIKQPVSTGSEQ